VFLFRSVDDVGLSTYHVIDGKQRLEAIIAFVKGEFPAPDTFTPLAGMSFGDFDSPTKRSVWDYQLQVEFLTTTDEAVLQEVFDRLNRNVAQLKPQELRHARFGGAFSQLTERLAELLPQQLPKGVPNIPEVRRMRDVEFVASLLIYVERGTRGTSQADLDSAYAEWDDHLPELPLEATFMTAIRSIGDLLALHEDLATTRLRNLTDFYSLFGAVVELSKTPWAPSRTAAEAILDLMNRVEGVRLGEIPTEVDRDAAAYYEAARSAVNEERSRDTRIRIVTEALTREPRGV